MKAKNMLVIEKHVVTGNFGGRAKIRNQKKVFCVPESNCHDSGGKIGFNRHA
jgi:hypothetical protein